MRKDKNTATMLSLFLGWFGIHQIYLRQPGTAMMFMAVFWVFGIGPAVTLGVLNALLLMLMSDRQFEHRYNRDKSGTPRRKPQRTTRRNQPDFKRQTSNRGTSRNSRRRRPQSRTQTMLKRNPFKASGLKKFKEFDIKPAIEDFKRALEIDSKDIATHFNLACAYSLSEQKELAFNHLNIAVNLGFNDIEKIKTHDALAFLRIQDEWVEFEKNNFSFPKGLNPPTENLLDNDILLEQLNKLTQLRQKGLLSEKEFETEKKKLLRE